MKIPNDKRLKSLSVELSESELRVLRDVAFAAKRGGGKKLPASVVVRAMIRLLQELSSRFGRERAVEEIRRLLPAGGEGSWSRKRKSKSVSGDRSASS